MRTKIQIGETRYALTIESIIEGRPRIFVCKCNNCGNTTKIKQNKFGITKSCGCYKKRMGNDNPIYKGFEQISGKFWNSIKDNAKIRNIVFEISPEYAWQLLEIQQHRCRLTDLPIGFSNQRGKNGAWQYKWTASIDRINSTKGYIEGNIQWLHKDVNKMKMNLDQEYFLSLCRLIAKN